MQGKKILLADDSEDFRAVFALFFSSLGAIVVEVDNGLAAVEQGKEGEFDLAVIDLQMPGMNGLDAARLLKEYRPDLPMLCLSGEGMPFPMESDDGIFQGTFTKPASLREVGAKVQDLIS